MNDEDFSYDPATERDVVREHNARLEEESQLEQDRRSSGTYAEGAERLARILDALTSLATRRVE
jgi:hypothetical protein